MFVALVVFYALATGDDEELVRWLETERVPEVEPFDFDPVTIECDPTACAVRTDDDRTIQLTMDYGDGDWFITEIAET